MSAMTCSDCGRTAAGDVEEWLECDPMRELNVRCGAHLDDMHSDETIPDCQRATIANLRTQLSAATARAEAAEAELHAVTIRAHDSRALLQRLAKYVREDRAVTDGTTRLRRLADQVADYLQRTHDPRSILRSPQQKKPTDEGGRGEG